MHTLTKFIKNEMKPALGVTEPGAIAYATAKARSFTSGTVKHIKIIMNSGLYKNAFSCGIPNTSEVGIVFSVALGYIAGDPSLGLNSLKNVTDKDNEEAKKIVAMNIIETEISEYSSDIFIETRVETDKDIAVVIIRDSHVNIEKIILNGDVIFENNDIFLHESKCTDNKLVRNYSLSEIFNYIKQIDSEELQFIETAYDMNYALFLEGLHSPRTNFAKHLFTLNCNKIISEDEQKTASLLCNTAIEARVIGLNKPAMSISGSGAHGIIATLPLYAAYKVQHYSKEQLLRATALSYLVCMYIKEHSGKLSAFCGCAIAAGTGMACGLVFMRHGGLKELKYVINNMASSITGMICDGGNHGCALKGIIAVDAAYRSVDLALNGIFVEDAHGINGLSSENTISNMGCVAAPGMVETDKIITDIISRKTGCK